MKISYGILSTASITHRFIQAVQAYGDEVGAIASRSLEKAEEIAHRYGIAKAYGSYTSLYADETIDVIYIASNNASHAQEIEASLLAGKHVVCEKPMTLCEEDTKALFALAAKQKRLLMEAQKSVFLPVTQAVKELIQNNTLGRLHQIALTSSFPQPQATWMYDPLQGGVVLGSASYTIEYLDFLCEPDQIEVQAMGLLDEHGTCERVSMNFLYDDILVNSRISMHGDTRQHALFYFEDGYIEVPFYWKAREYHMFTKEGCQSFAHPVSFEMIYEVAHVHDCLTSGKICSDIMSPTRSIQCAKLVDQVLKQVGQR